MVGIVPVQYQVGHGLPHLFSGGTATQIRSSDSIGDRPAKGEFHSVSGIEMAEVVADFKRKEKLAQYKYRQTGLELVSRLGYQEALELYKTNPADFMDRLQMERG